MQKGLLEKIQGVRLTKTQRKIADYMLKYPELIGNMSTLEAANEIGVSDASVIRFARAIGFEGFSDLKAFIYQSLIDDSYATLSLSERMRQSTEQYRDSDVQTQFLELMQKNIAGSFVNNKPESYEEAVKMIAEASTCYVTGFRGLAGYSSSFSRLLSFMRKNVRSITDGSCVSISQMQDIRTGDILVMFTYARYYKIDLTYLRMAKQRGAKVILIIDSMLSPLREYGDLILLTETGHMSFFNSTIGATFIGEYLLSLLGRKMDFRERSDERDMITAEERL